jgi:hypothetical protein
MRTLMESISEMQDIRNQGKYTRADIAAADARYKELEQKYGYWDEIDDVISENAHGNCQKCGKDVNENIADVELIRKGIERIDNTVDCSTDKFL